MCENCKAQWHLISGINGLQWAILENASETGEGEKYVGKKFDKEQWRKYAQKTMNATAKPAPAREVNEIVREKEIIREKEGIIKIRCSYCKNLFNETLDKCPHCGARA